MRVRFGWLALLLLGAGGTAARAQGPFMYGPQPYPYAQPMPYYAAPAFPAPAYYPQPQPRVVYVPATPTDWSPTPAPSQAAPTPIQPVGASRVAKSDDGSVVIVGPTNNSTIPAKVASRRRSAVVEDLGDGCGPDGCVAPGHCLNDDCINWLPKGRWNVQMLGGAYSDIGNARYSWGQSSLRLGHIWDCECFSHCPGAFEGLIDLNGGYAFDNDFGNFFTGMGLLCRYNLSTPGSRLVPYIQAGVGFQYNDAYQDLNQSYLGSRMALTAQGQLGLRIFLAKCISLDLEGGYQHISDMNMSNRNDGINAIGGMGGLTLFFPCCGRR